MTPIECDQEIDFIQRYQVLNEDEKALLHLLADDPNVNRCGVYVDGYESLYVASNRVTAELQVVKGKNDKWFFGVSHTISMVSGGGFAPSIKQALWGEAKESRKDALLACVDVLKRRVESELREYPQLQKDFLSQIESFCIKEIFDATHGLPLFNT